jgi:perosamine synthetase
MDIDRAISSITDATKAIIYTSLNGRANSLHRLKQACSEKGVFLIEDACQGLGSKKGEKYLGTIGDIGCFSLSPHKIISTGQGGFTATNNEIFAGRMRRFKNSGRDAVGEDFHSFFGINLKFNDLQAVVGIEQLKRIKERIARKKKIYSQYYHALKGVTGLGLSMIPITKEHTPWFVDVYCDTQLELKMYLKDRGIESRLMYPPIYEQPCYSGFDYLLFGAYDFSTKGLWLPSSVSLSDEDIEYICTTIKKFYNI